MSLFVIITRENLLTVRFELKCSLIGTSRERLPRNTSCGWAVLPHAAQKSIVAFPSHHRNSELIPIVPTKGQTEISI
jgi:hypothetical protein